VIIPALIGWLLAPPIAPAAAPSAPAPASESTCEGSVRHLPPETIERIAEATTRDELTAVQVAVSLSNALGPEAKGGDAVAALADVADRVQRLGYDQRAADLWEIAAKRPIEACLRDTQTAFDWARDAADAFRKLRKTDLAERIYRQMLRIGASWQLPPDDRNVLLVQTSLADTLRIAGRYREAQQLLDQALRNARPDPKDEPYVYALQRRAILLDDGPGSDPETAQAYRSVAAAWEAGGHSVWQREKGRLNLAKFLILTGQAAEALTMAEAVLEARGGRTGVEDAYLTEVLDVVIAAANQLGDWARVAEAARRAASIIALSRGPRNEAVGQWLARQHAALIELGNLPRAVEVEHAVAALGLLPTSSPWEERVRLGRQLATQGRFDAWVHPPPTFRLLFAWPWEASWRHPDGTVAIVSIGGAPQGDLFGLGADEPDAATLRRRTGCPDAAVRLERVGSPVGELDVARCTEPAGDEERIVEVTAMRRGDVRVYLTVKGRTSTRATVEAAGRAVRAGLVAPGPARPR
jgi:hypothetical protein